MALNFDAIESQIAADIGTGMAAGINDGVGNLALPPSAVEVITSTVIWAGTTSVLAADTSQLSEGNLIRLDADGGWFRVVTITVNTGAIIENLYNLTIPSGSSGTSKALIGFPEPSDPQTIEDSMGAAIATSVRNALETFAADAEISGVTAGGATIGPGVIA